MGVEMGLVLARTLRRWRTLPTHRSDRVHPRCLRSSEDHADTFGLEYLIEQCGELAVPISDQESGVVGSITQVEHQVAGFLSDSAGRRIRPDPSTWTRCVACSTTTKQYSRASVIVSTLKKSQAKIPDAWVLRNCAQVGSPRRGAGSNAAFFEIAQTVAGATFRSRPAISPAMPRWPQVGFSVANCRTRADEQALPTVPGEQPRERGNNRPVRPRRPGNGDLATKHRELMPQYQDLCVFGRL